MVGAGAVGGYFGALLHRSGADLTFLVRKNTGQILRKEGLTVESYKETFTVKPSVVTSENLTGFYDLIVMAVKCYDLENAAEDIRKSVGSNTAILTLQNGIDSEERLMNLFGKHAVMGGVAFITSKIISPGRIGHYKRGIMTIGELDGAETERIKKVFGLLKSAGIPVFLSNEIMKRKWEKLCWNATFNPLSVLMDGPVSLILDSPEALDAVRFAIEEVRTVALKEGITLSPKIGAETIEASAGLKEYHTSMYEDWKSVKPTENDYLNGAVCRMGKRHGVSTPVNFLLYQGVAALTDRRQVK